MNQLNFLTQTRTAWSCASWQPTTSTMQTMWRCRSILPCCSPSAATAALPSCESPEFSGSSSCWVPWMPTETRKNTETCTACWLRTPRPTTAGYKRWGHTARRVDAWTSGCLNWSCRNAEGSSTRKTPTNTGAFWVQILMMNRRIRCCSCRGGLEWTGTGYRDRAGTKGPISVTGGSGDRVEKSTPHCYQ